MTQQGQQRPTVNGTTNGELHPSFPLLLFRTRFARKEVRVITDLTISTVHVKLLLPRTSGHVQRLICWSHCSARLPSVPHPPGRVPGHPAGSQAHYYLAPPRSSRDEAVRSPDADACVRLVCHRPRLLVGNSSHGDVHPVARRGLRHETFLSEKHVNDKRRASLFGDRGQGARGSGQKGDLESKRRAAAVEMMTWHAGQLGSWAAGQHGLFDCVLQIRRRWLLPHDPTMELNPGGTSGSG